MEMSVFLSDMYDSRVACTLIQRPGEFGGVRVTQEARAAGIGVSLCETHPVDVTRLLLATRDRAKKRNQGLFVYSYLQWRL